MENYSKEPQNVYSTKAIKYSKHQPFSHEGMNHSGMDHSLDNSDSCPTGVAISCSLYFRYDVPADDYYN